MRLPWLILPLLCGTALAQQPPVRKVYDPHPDVPQQKVEEAIQKGIEFLKTVDVTKAGKAGRDAELVLLTMIHARVPESDPKFQELLEFCMKEELAATYNVTLLAMSLEELDRVKYQLKILQCAQFLVDNQHENGRWSYGSPSPFVKNVATTGGKPVRTGSKPSGPLPPLDINAPPEKPPVKVKIPVKKMESGGAGGGDNSNSQYGALGFRACHDAGIVIPRDLIEKARKSWYDTQREPETGAAGKGAVASGATPRGWCYSGKGGEGQPGQCGLGGPPYSSMTAGAVSALVIYDGMLGIDWKKDKAVKEGMAWLDAHWTVTQNAPQPEAGGGKKDGRTFLSYYLYALERVGMLYDAVEIGKHDWYKEGALFLLEKQRGNGSWENLSDSASAAVDTSFAILFLKRATRPMVASGTKK